MSKDKISIVKLQLLPGKATPAPPVGSVLGQRGVNIMDFCKKFNDITKDMGNLRVTVIISINPKDKSFTLKVNLPSASDLIKEECGITSGSKEPGKNIVYEMSLDQVRKVAQVKMQDMSVMTVDAAMNVIAGTARSMGIKVIN
ncbi:50S ribosomal protein L11 [Candidatus Deianiraea vastatrix]|uniref:Large ribosomal subunit protein uL11 n=1 Tax=Candidatus Deianiraea vastatrix TaxID=2163644 RepID=A0A5B8XCV5_9RICK|nr:50S ribosomal protein L11 [Candidatus Deianiraea vastatrix]QED23143.1 50S ribosomal protein L11 [Candidatus Deianiraea vastatrix]